MKKRITKATLLICTIVIGMSHSNAQVFRKGKPVICPIDPVSHDIFVAPPALFLKKMQEKNSGGQQARGTAEFVVTYNGFTEEAKAAFQFAVDIWSSLLDSPVPIHVEANFREFDNGNIGSGFPSFVRDFEGSLDNSVFYPMSLAEKLGAQAFNTDREPDIFVNFNSTTEFYFGTDGNPPADQFDFVTLVLHELAHGLGFLAYTSYDAATGAGFFGIANTGLTMIYANFVELGDGTAIKSLSNGGVETGSALVSDDLFFNGPFSVTELGERPKLSAPLMWSGSYGHLDAATYPAGDENSLMSPGQSLGEAVHNPGISLAILNDIGWGPQTTLSHTSSNNVLFNIDNLTVKLSVRSDTTINTQAAVVTYTYSDFDHAIDIPLVDSGDGINFTADIPIPETSGLVKYYFTGVQDGLGRDYTSPNSVPDNFYQVTIINQVIKPVPYLAADGGSFEVNQNDFQAGSLSGDAVDWELGTPTNALNQPTSGTNVWKTKLNTDIAKPSSYTVSALFSPYFNLSDDTKHHTLSFSYAMEGVFYEDDDVWGPYGFHVQYSIDDGLNWNLLGEVGDPRGTNWYNIEEVDPTVFPAEAPFGWIKDAPLTEENVSFNISQLAGNPKVIFRLVFYVDHGFSSGYGDGVLIDDFEITKSSPTADFKLTTESEILFPGAEVQFEYLSTGASTYSWDFGDGGTSDIANPTHVYSDGGLHDVTLMITSPDGTASLTKEDFVSIIPQRGVPYLIADGGGLEGASLDFTILNVAGTGFELGSSSVAGKSGTASGSNAFVTGINEETYEDDSEAYIYTPEFDFSNARNYEFSFKTNYSFESGFDGFIVEYTTDRGMTWTKLNNNIDIDNWYNQMSHDSEEFGDDEPIFSGSTDGSFLRKFADVTFLAGEDQVAFRIKFLTNGFDGDVGMAIDDFEMTQPDPTADFKLAAESEISFPGAEVQFEYLSTGASTYLWNFGDGGTSDIANPTHIYSDGGLYDVTLMITSPYGTASLTKEDFVSIIPQREVPYLIADGGGLEGASLDFTILNVAGTGFELGSSNVAGKSGTASGSNAFVTGINEETYEDDSEAHIYTPEFDFSNMGNYEFSFKTNYRFEPSFEGFSFDGFIVEYTTDRGVTWTKLNNNIDIDNWYNATSDEFSEEFGGDEPIFSDSTDGSFLRKFADVTFLAGEDQVAFRIKFLTDFDQGDVGMAIDDFELTESAGGVAVVDFSFEGNTGCSGHEVVFTNNSNGTIEALNWDFGIGATPATAEGSGPHTVIFESTEAITSNITLTATSSVSGTVSSEQTLTTAPTFEVEPFTISVLGTQATLVAPEGDKYQWILDGEPIDGETDQELTVTEFNSDQQYSVEIDRGGCSVISEEHLMITAIEEQLQKFGVVVFPNPATASVNINIDHRIKDYLTIKIFNYSGKQIFTHTVNESMDSYQKVIDLSNQKTGLYHLELVIDGERLSNKILVE